MPAHSFRHLRGFRTIDASKSRGPRAANFVRRISIFIRFTQSNSSGFDHSYLARCGRNTCDLGIAEPCHYGWFYFVTTRGATSYRVGLVVEPHALQGIQAVLILSRFSRGPSHGAGDPAQAQQKTVKSLPIAERLSSSQVSTLITKREHHNDLYVAKICRSRREEQCLMLSPCYMNVDSM